jgi:hypothetical protein
MRPRCRHLLQIGILLLIVRVVADIATPLLPGAFCLDPTTSVQAAETVRQVAAAVPVVQSGPPGQRVSIQAVQPRRTPPLPPHVPGFFLRIAHLSEFSSPSTSDDD